MRRRKVLNKIAISATISTILVACDQTNNSSSSSIQVDSLPNIK